MNFNNNFFLNRFFNTCFVLAAGMTVLLMTSTSHAALIINDSFSDGSRTTQSLPSSTEWYSRAGTSTASVSGSTLNFDLVAAPDNGVVGYFTNSGAIDLAIGQSISLSFDLTVNSPHALSGEGDRLRFGLMNSGGSRETSDESNFNSVSGTYSNYEGYWALFTPNFGGVRASIQERNGTQDALPTTNAMTLLGNTFDTNDANNNLEPDTTYQYTLEIVRTSAGTNTITATVGGLSGVNTFVQTDVTLPFDSFDTAVISLHDFSDPQHPTEPATLATIGNITVTTSVPEPSTLVMWSLASVTLLMKRRASRASATSFFA